MDESTRLSRIVSALPGQTRRERDLVVAELTVAVAKQYAWVEPPAKPMKLPPDAVIMDLADQASRGKQVDQTKAGELRLFGVWRASVWHVEDANAMHAALLCQSYRVLDAADRADESALCVDVLATHGLIDWGQAPVEFMPLVEWAKREQRKNSLVMTKALRNAGLV